jgi:DNA-binding beta-propeller fold protein YncE/cytochrome c553
MKLIIWRLCAVILFGLSASIQAADPAALYQEHCVACHGADRLGVTGPALFAENLERIRPAERVKVITEGRPATQMAGFAGKLAPADIAALAKWITAPVLPPPAWSEAQMRASFIEYFAPGSLPDKPAFKADMMNLFVVVETGDHHVTILDGDRLAPIFRFPSRFALHGGPKFTPDGRYVFFASRDGWISKFDIWNLKVVAEIRAGINTRNLAVSDDGKYVMVANYLPRTVVLLDGNLSPLKTLEARSLDGKETSRVSAAYDAAPRKSFVVAMKDMPELWEISYDPKAADIFDGLVHDFRMGEGLGKPGFLNPRRTRLEEPLDDFFFDQSYSNIMGASRQGGKGAVVNLDAHKKIADLDLPGMPHLGSGITWAWHGTTVLASPNLQQGVVTVINMKTWQPVAHIATPGPGFFIRSHENSPYAWTDSMMSREHKDTLTVLAKETLAVVAKLTPEPGKTLAHVEFTKDGRYALVSLMEALENGGALIVFDAQTLKEVKRIPMNKPVGKYNLFNKITRSEGTSH